MKPFLGLFVLWILMWTSTVVGSKIYVLHSGLKESAESHPYHTFHAHFSSPQNNHYTIEITRHARTAEEIEPTNHQDAISVMVTHSPKHGGKYGILKLFEGDDRSKQHQEDHDLSGHELHIDMSSLYNHLAEIHKEHFAHNSMNRDYGLLRHAISTLLGNLRDHAQKFDEIRDENDSDDSDTDIFSDLESESGETEEDSDGVIYEWKNGKQTKGFWYKIEVSKVYLEKYSAVVDSWHSGTVVTTYKQYRHQCTYSKNGQTRTCKLVDDVASTKVYCNHGRCPGKRGMGLYCTMWGDKFLRREPVPKKYWKCKGKYSPLCFSWDANSGHNCNADTKLQIQTVLSKWLPNTACTSVRLHNPVSLLSETHPMLQNTLEIGTCVGNCPVSPPLCQPKYMSYFPPKDEIIYLKQGMN